MVINPKCNQKDQIMNICLRHDGYVVPCCFLADIGVPWEKLKKLLGDKLEQIHIRNNTIDDINKSEAYKIIYESFTNNPMQICLYQCGNKKQCHNKKDHNTKIASSGHPYVQAELSVF